GLIALLVSPLVTQGKDFADQLPDYVDQAKRGQGPVGDLVTRFHLDTYVTSHKQQLRQQALGLGTSATHVLSTIASTLAAVLSIVTLEVTGVPYAGVIAVFVALADLVPLVGATIGAVIACLVAFLHSVPAGIVAVVFFVVYQQLENHLLQPVVLSRTVKINP